MHQDGQNSQQGGFNPANFGSAGGAAGGGGQMPPYQGQGMPPGMMPGMPPMGGGTMQQGMMPPMPPMPPVDDEPYTFGELIAKHTIKISLPPHPSIAFDERKFLQLLAGSISLTKDEKRKIVESVPRLSQKQIMDLMDILLDEKAKFIELSPKHKPQLKKLEKQHFDEWVDLEIKYAQENKARSDQEEADRIRKQLGLS